MTYTKEFEKWSREIDRREPFWNEDFKNDFEWDHALLSAFARLVREKTVGRTGDQNGIWVTEDEALGEAFNTICDRFGLGEK